MIDSIFNGIARFFQLFVFWYVVEQWEQCMRVRMGKHVKKIGAGFHFKIPYFDTIHRQSCRYRTALCSPQTLTTADGHTVVCTFALGYALEDIEKLYQTLYDVNDTLEQTVSSFVADEVAKLKREELSAAYINDKLTNMLADEFHKYGLKDITVRLQDFAFIKAFRLIQDHRWQNSYGIQTSHVGAQQ